MSRLGSSALAVVLVAVLSLAAYADPLMVAASVVVVQVLVASAPSPADARGRAVPGPRFAAALSGGLVATVVTLFPGLLDGAQETSTQTFLRVDTGMFVGVLPAVVVTVFVALLSQMARTDGRPNLVSTTSYAVALGVFATLAVGWIGAAQSLGRSDIVVIGAAGLAGGVLVWAVPLDRVLVGSGAVLAGGAAGAAVVVLLDVRESVAFGIAVGSGAALFAVTGQVLGRAWSRGKRHAETGWGFPAAMSVALAAPVVYVGSQLMGVTVTITGS